MTVQEKKKKINSKDTPLKKSRYRGVFFFLETIMKDNNELKSTKRAQSYTNYHFRSEV